MMRFAVGLLEPRCELRIVDEDGPHSHQDRVRSVAPAVNFRTGGRAGNPAALAGASGDAPVKAGGELGDDVWPAGGDPGGEVLVQLPRFLLPFPHNRADSRRVDLVTPAAGDARIGVERGDVDLAQTGVDRGVSTA